MRQPSRYERRHAVTKKEKTVYGDNLGNEYDHKFIAKMSSFYNMVMGMFRNGFPIVSKKLRYDAWAFYPFFFVRASMQTDTPLVVLNHERIHIRQQREIHIVVSVPLIIVSFWIPMLLIFTPFIPTLFYYADILRVYFKFKNTMPKEDRKKFSELRKYTCFEAEAISNAPNLEYLYERKFFAVLNYRGKL